MACQGRPSDLENKIARLLMTRVAGHEVAARLKEVDAGWHDRAAMADLRARRAEMQRDAGYRDFDNVYSLDGARMRSAVG